ncbi:MAG: glutamyl-tRNA reductase [Candidatus Omnitrophota bacterium]
MDKLLLEAIIYMETLVLGLSHKTAPVELREKLSFSEQNLERALCALRQYPVLKENVILSTCNRVELYAVCVDIPRGRQILEKFFSDFHSVDLNILKPYFYFFSSDKTIEHLFRVVSSLDSMVVGETQIFSQVKNAFLKAKETNTAGKVLDNIFTRALSVGRKVRHTTGIGKGAVSVSTAAVGLVRHIFDTLEGKKILIIGAGKVSELTVKNLVSRGAATILVANHTFTSAHELANKFSGVAIRFDKITQYLAEVDIIISSTAAPQVIVHYKQILEIMQKRGPRPLFLIDLAVPRDIDAEVSKIDNVYLYNIDHLTRILDRNLKERMQEAQKAEQIIADDLAKYLAQCETTKKWG